jgi:hypothetical protein
MGILQTIRSKAESAIQKIGNLGNEAKNTVDKATPGTTTEVPKYNEADKYSDLANPLSYCTIINSRRQFIRSGTRLGDDFNYYDNPVRIYFKILFYFNNSDVENGNSNTGLLAPTWLESTLASDWSTVSNSTYFESNYFSLDEKPTQILSGQLPQSPQEKSESEATTETATAGVEPVIKEKYWMFDSAYSYLMNNNEKERAMLLRQFVELLSNISSRSPWYFQEITGLDEALKRQLPPSAEPKKINIKCLKDSVDNRIGTLMDLYRSVVWSWQKKCEIVPANLRKFDMGIFLFSAPIKPLHKIRGAEGDEYAVIHTPNSGYMTSYKYIEFHNCEFDYNSATTGYSNLKNTDGIEPEYTISITFDDCYEQRYNEFSFRNIGDMIAWDALESNAKMDGFRSKNWNDIGNGTGVDVTTQKKLSQEILNANAKDILRVDSNIINGRYAQYVLQKMKEKQVLNQNNTDDGIVTKFLKKTADKYTKQVNNKIDSAVKSALNTASKEVTGYVAKTLNSKLTRAFMGNINSLSLDKLADQITGLKSGRIFETVSAIKEYTEKNSRKTLSFTGIGAKKKVHKNFGYTGEPLGNLYRARTILNNL